MLSIGLWRWYIDITITILDTIHHLVFYEMFQILDPVVFKLCLLSWAQSTKLVPVPDAELCLRLQVVTIQLGPIDRASPSLSILVVVLISHRDKRVDRI
jgi:hypothetical protein